MSIRWQKFNVYITEVRLNLLPLGAEPHTTGGDNDLFGEQCSARGKDELGPCVIFPIPRGLIERLFDL